MDNLVSILKFPVLNPQVKAKILRLVQNWASAFEGKPMLGYVSQVCKTLKGEGMEIDPFQEASFTNLQVSASPHKT